jgi:hypothetical protein
LVRWKAVIAAVAGEEGDLPTADVGHHQRV